MLSQVSDTPPYPHFMFFSLAQASTHKRLSFLSSTFFIFEKAV